MQNVMALAIAIVAIVVFSLAGLAARKRYRAAAGPSLFPSPPADGEGELVAVIAAAVAAASGREADSFRIVGIDSSPVPIARDGFNTPVWGHVDRFSRGE